MALLVLAIPYVMSYAPIYRLKHGRPIRIVTTSDFNFRRYRPPCLPAIVRAPQARPWVPLSIYRPVEWLIDYTPLREPLMHWAELWDVRAQMSWNSVGRMRQRSPIDDRVFK